MLLDIYILLIVLGTIFMAFSFFRKDIAFFAFISFVFFISAGISSYKIEQTFCNISSGTWSCHTEEYSLNPIAYLWIGLGMIMLVYGVVMAFWSTGEELEKGLRGRE